MSTPDVSPRVRAVPRALYFGCWAKPGHYLHNPDGSTLWTRPIGFPWTIGLMDAGLLRNHGVPDEPDGRVHWTCGGRRSLWFAFVWWDRSVDRRGACNSGLYAEGFKIGQSAAAFEFACKAFPAVVSRQRYPLTLQP